MEYFGDNISREHVLPALSIIGTIVFIVVVGYFLTWLVRMEEEDIQKKQSLKNINNNNNGKENAIAISVKLILTQICFAGVAQQKPYVPELRLHELRAEKYNGLVRLLKPGCRTIILITDMQSRPKLIPGFHKAVWPYRKYV